MELVWDKKIAIANVSSSIHSIDVGMYLARSLKLKYGFYKLLLNIPLMQIHYLCPAIKKIKNNTLS